MAGGGLPVPRNPVAAGGGAPTGGAAPPVPSGPAPWGKGKPLARTAPPPLRLDARGRALTAGPGPGWTRLWALFPLVFVVAILAGVWDAAAHGRPTPAAAPAAPAAVSSRATPSPSSPGQGAAGAGGAAPQPAEDALRRFYRLLSDGDRAGAYALLSVAVRQEYPRARFDESWRRVRHVRLVSAAPLSGGRAPDGVRVQACVEVLPHASGSGEGRTLYGGPVTLVREGDAYRVGPSALRRVPAC
jgi:hypothetical protein